MFPKEIVVQASKIAVHAFLKEDMWTLCMQVYIFLRR